MPVAGAVAENGGLSCPSTRLESVALTPIPNLANHRQHLGTMFEKLQLKSPQMTESADNCFGITDWTFHVAALTENELQYLSVLCQQQGWGFTYSNVQCHIKPQGQDKAVGLLQVLREYSPEYTASEIVTVGDNFRC